MSLQSWLRSLRAQFELSKTARRVKADVPRAVQLAESLESRCLLAVTPILIDGTDLIVQLEAGDNVVIQSDPAGNLEVLSSGLVVNGNPSIATVDITSIMVTGGDGSNLIDLTGVTTADFDVALTITVNGGDGNDTILGSDFADSLVGGNGGDSITGALADDTLEGSNGNDTLSGGVGDDSILGGDGADSINGNVGNDTVIAGNGADNVSGGDGTDSLNGSDGSDTLNGDAGDDTLSGDNGTDSLLGGADNDSLLGGTGNDTASGGDGTDILNGGIDNDSLNGDDGTDSIDGGDGNDTLLGGAGNDTINGGTGNDTALGNAGLDSILGGAGHDLLAGGDDVDTILGQAGNDTLFGGAATDSLDGGAGNDLIQGLGATVSISDAVAIAEGDSGLQLAVFTVNLAQASAVSVQVDFTTQDGSAVAGLDYQATSGTLTFVPGQTNATISVPVFGDTTGEGAESFSVQLTARLNALIETATGMVDITDNDVSISITDVSAPEGNSGQSTLQVTVSLNRASTIPVTVSFATLDGDAVGGLDYVANSGGITFAPNTTTATIDLAVFGENVGENSEVFFVNLSNPSGAVLADAQAIVTIVDDDGGPLVAPVVPSGFLYDDDDEHHNDEHDHDGGQAGGGGELPPQGFQIANRWTVTATDGPGLGPGDATTLTWGIVPDGTTTAAGCGANANQTSNLIATLDAIYNETATGPDIRNRTWFQLFQSVFDDFESFSGLRFVYEPNDDSAPISGGANGVLGVRADIRIVGHNIPAPVIGCNFFPNFGDMALATNSGFFNFTAFNSRGLRNTVGHELGHGLGLGHVVPSNQTKLMEPGITFAFDGPQEDEILAANRSYGDRNEVAGGNDTSATATVLGTFAPVASTSVTQVSIDAVSDSDVYGFTLSSAALTTITVTPTGTSYLQGPQSGTPSPTTFNALAQSDLSFEILATDGTTVLVTAASNGLGVSEQVVGLNLAAGSYFVRVTGIQDSVQMYDISLAAAAPPAPPAAPSVADGDLMNGGDGNDTLSGADGRDTLNGMAGNDSLAGGGGNDSILGGAGSDTIDGQAGDDTVDGQGGNDRVAGGDGSDTYVWNGTGDGVDTLSSLSGYDRVRVQGSAVANNFVVSQNNGQLRITDGVAVLNVSPIIQVVDILAGGGDDTITIGALDRVRTATLLTVDGSDGNDTINSNGANIGLMRVSLIGGLGDDSLTGSAGLDSLDGGDGDDVLDAQGGNDLIFAGLGDDTILGGAGNDRIFAGDGSDTIDAGAGDDAVIADIGADTINGGDGNDTIDGGDGTDTIDGGDGNDSILGGNEADSLNGNIGNDTVRGGASDDTITGENGNDKLYGDDGNDSIVGHDGDDTINGGDGDDTLDGLNGNDLLGGGNGDDVMNGAAGNDTLTGGDGNDTMAGGAGRDVLLGDEGDDSLNGQGGFDTINPGEGSDTVFDLITEIDTTFTLSAALLAALA